MAQRKQPITKAIVPVGKSLTEARRRIQRNAAEATALECEEMEALSKLTRDGFWQNSLISQLLCDFGRGERSTPQQVFLLLADCVDAIESTPANSAMGRRLAGKPPKRGDKEELQARGLE